MKKWYKVVLINVIGAILISLLFAAMIQQAGVFLIALGATCGLLGFANILVGLVLIPLSNKEWSQAFLLSGGVLFLLGVGICGPMFIFM